MKAIPEMLKEELAREFTQEQIEECFKRLKWITRVCDRGEDNQIVLNEKLVKWLKRREKQVEHAPIIRIKINQVALLIPQVHSRP